MKWIIVILIVLAIIGNQSSRDRLGSATVSYSEGISNTLFTPNSNPNGQNLFKLIIIVGGIYFLTKKKDPKS